MNRHIFTRTDDSVTPNMEHDETRRLHDVRLDESSHGRLGQQTLYPQPTVPPPPFSEK